MPDIDGGIFDGDAFQAVRPIAVVENWDQSRYGVNDRVPKLLSPLVAIAGGAAAGVGLPSGRDNQ